MKRALAGILAGVAVGAAVDAQAASFVDRENGTISRNVQTGVTSSGKPYFGIEEVINCKRGWIAVQRASVEGGPALIDLTVGHGSGNSVERQNYSAAKRAADVRAECKAAGLEPGF